MNICIIFATVPKSEIISKEKKDIYIISRYLPTNYLLVTKEKSNNFRKNKKHCIKGIA